jgi:hypothetical protein
MSKPNITVTLGSYNMDNATTEADLESFGVYVVAHLDEYLPRLADRISVEVDDFGTTTGVEVTGYVTDEDREAIETAINVDLWNDWCSAPKSQS